MGHDGIDREVAAWLAALEARHLADLRVPEVTRALRALSSAYVQRRTALARGAALDSAGKRAAFALFYAPLHLLVTHHVLAALGPGQPATVIDLGCGTGAAGAAWSLACGGRPHVIGIDRHPWAVAEARWTYQQLGLTGHARQGDAERFRPPRGATALVAAYLLNELPETARARVVDTLLDAAAHGSSVLVIEPIARAVAPWWDAVAARVIDAGGRADEWNLTLDLPPLLEKFDRAAGLHHERMKARSVAVIRDS